MDFLTWTIVIVFFVTLVGKLLMVANSKKAMEKELGVLPDFTPTQKLMGNNGETGIAVDEGRKKICLIKSEASDVSLKVISYRDVLSSEIFVDGETVTKTVRSSQIGGALLGGLAFGGVGAIIGGLSGRTKSSKKVKRVDLRITVNDTKNPHHDINFMDTEGKQEGFVYKQSMNKARHWHGLIAVLIKDADFQDDNETKLTVTEDLDVSSNRLVADELLKLSELKEKGFLTDTEFAAQKQKLLT